MLNTRLTLLRRVLLNEGVEVLQPRVEAFHPLNTLNAILQSVSKNRNRSLADDYHSAEIVHVVELKTTQSVTTPLHLS